jgi:AcrR family transcriptional regulator
MRQNENAVRRPRGRPQIRCDEDTRRVLTEAAQKAFTANGYAGTNMCDVAQSAGISTKTMYRLVPTKAELFTTVIAQGIGDFMLEVDEKILAKLELEEALERILHAFGTLTLSEETIALNRLIIAEYDRFPEIADTFYETAIKRVSSIIGDWLNRQRQLGAIVLTETEAATSALRGMMIMDLQRATMLGQRPAPDAKEIAERARFCARIFLDGCRAEKTESTGGR